MSRTIEIPADHADLLERALIGHLATQRPNGQLQVNPMWFQFDGTNIRFTHTSKRAKFHNLQANPAMAFAITDPENQQRYIELRGTLIDTIPDPTGAFYQELGRRYGTANTPPPPDAADRVILVMAIDAVGGVR